VSQALNDLAAKAGVRWFDYQREALEAAAAAVDPAVRFCLYFKTGAGKSLTALGQVALTGHTRAVVVAPPSTHSQWITLGTKLGIEVEAMSHAKFRMKDTKLSRHVALIADEMHMFGGNTGKGWVKLSTLARHLRAPLIMASATPNYNDAERCYCIEAVLDPARTKGGYLNWIYRHCETEADPFSMTPKVLGFNGGESAAEYLAGLPGVFYLEDDTVYTINDVAYSTPLPMAYEVFGYNERKHRLVASGMEDRHTRIFHQLVDEQGLIHDHVFEFLLDLAASATTPLLVYADHSTVADALGQSLKVAGTKHAVVTGQTPKAQKDELVTRFKRGEFEVLVGTASISTGTDGIDKMCDWLIILDDTTDDAARRQLVGRIMPRGADTDASRKQVYRLLHE
jgi:hypothetical protein